MERRRRFIGYDIRGRKTSMSDPNMGAWLYRYNVFGELIWQKDAKGQTVSMTYDSLGRMLSRTEAEGTSWVYDTAAGKGIGKLHQVNGVGGYQETHAYDSHGRPETLTKRIDGVNYTHATSYDSSGRPSRITYPVTGIGSNAFAVRHVYNDFGYLKEIRTWLDADSTRANNALQGQIWWMADSYHVSGRIDGERYGNGTANDRFYSPATGRLIGAYIDRASITGPIYGVQQLNYTYDKVGNVVKREDAAPAVGRVERFYNSFSGGVSDGYDGLDRLKLHRVEGGSTVSVSYGQNGNITSKSDVGSYAYNGIAKGPHAVSSAGSFSDYQYDANGNMTQGSGRTLQWTSFNQLKVVSNNSSGKVSEFSFGADHQRVKQVRKQGTTVIDTTIYAGSLYEKVTTAGSNLIEHKHYVMAPTGRIAVYTQRSDFSKDTRYFHTDGLGSITVVTGEAGRVLKRYAYDAWGKQTTLSTNDASWASNQAPTTRGFTDHEMLVDQDLIHMNGRVYDPVLGRFLSADPFVENGADAQAYNRYSYVGNNPLGATDPTGYISWKDVGRVVGVIAAAILTAGVALYAYGAAIGGTFTGGFLGALGSVGSAAGWGTGWAVTTGAGIGFGSSFAASLLNGGSIGDAFSSGLIGAGIGALSAGIAGKLGIGGIPDSGGQYFKELAAVSAVSGLAGGVNSELHGGQFRHGFRQGAISGAVGYVALTGLDTYLNEQGQNVFPDGGSQNPAYYDRVRINGVMGNRADMQAKINLARQPTLGYFNPSQGIINDVMQSFWQKLAFGYGDSLAAGFGRLTSQMAPGSLLITAHSQGTLTVTNAVFQGAIAKGSTLNLRSPAISYPRAWLAGRVNGGTMNYIQPWGDGANLWATAVNPFKYASGVTDILLLGKIHTGNNP